MAKPHTRQELVNYGLRQLGAPVLEINIADEQIDDLLDDTIQHFQERHYDGVVRTYLKYELTKEDIKRGGDFDPMVNPGITTVGPVTYPNPPTQVEDKYVENSNWIHLPDYVIGVEKVYVPPEATGSGFIGYPNLIGPDGGLAGGCGGGGFGGLAGMGYLNGGDMISYFMAKQWIATFDYMFNPDAAIRFNKRMDRLYLDINWRRLSAGDLIVVDCYRALDPEQFVEVYNDSWVKKWFTALLKKQWGQNLMKFKGTRLAGGIEMNGREIYDEGVKELEIIKNDMSSHYELPPLDMIG